MTSMVQKALRNAARTSIILLVFAVVATALLVWTYTRTQPHIERSQQAAKLALLSQVLPHRLYDNDLLASRLNLAPDARLGTHMPSAMWIARRGNAVTAVVLEAIAPDGYSGAIHLLIGIDVSGVITGVRVTGHRETPGLGDYIEHGKSTWVEQFVGKALDRPPAPAWTVRKDGGAFDARAGATITPRAVVKAVGRALDYYSYNRKAITAIRPVGASAGSEEN